MTEFRFPDIGETLLAELLPNGLMVLADPKPEFQKTFAFFAANYGGMDLRWQENGETITTPAGVAHYLEHKMFDTKDGNALQMLSGNGASANAFTASDITGYYFECTEGFEENLKTLLSFVSVPYFTAESVAKEQGIIGQEIRMIEDNPDWQLYESLLTSLYASHPLHNSVPGTVESIAEITPELLYRCHRTFYHPCNMVLVVTGKLKNPERVAALARQILPSSHQTPPVHDYGAPEPKTAVRREVRLKMAVSASNFLLGFKDDTPPFGEGALRAELVGELAAELLCGDATALYSRLYSEGLINKTFGGGYSLQPGAGFLVLGGESKQPERVRELLLEEAQRLVREGIDPSHFARVRRALYGSRVRALNSFESICIQQARSYFKGHQYFTFGQVYESITPQEVLDFLSRCVTEERSALAVVNPV